VTAQTATARLLTAPARGGIAVIALTGPAAEAILTAVFRPRGRGPEPGRLSLGWIVRGDERIDEAVVAAPRPQDDPTGGGGFEINIHGGPQVAREVLVLLARHGARILPDDPIDPTLLLPHADHANPAVAEEMLRALRRAPCPLAAAAVTAQWRAGLSALAASEHPAAAELRQAAEALTLMRRLLEPAEVVVAGPPNVGKSALTNALVGRNVCIVSETPGTTRDWVRQLADADGVPVWLTDTAGLWVGSGREAALEGEAVRRAWERIESADLVVCVAAGQPEPRYRPMLRRLRAQPGVLNVANKIDALAPDPDAEVAVSARSGEGLARLRSAIRGRLGFADFDPQAPGAFTPRQARLLRAAADALDRGDGQCARRALETLLRGPLEPVAEENSAPDAGDGESQAISRAGGAKG